ncbi:hypothetical protein [Aciditerrimonas ferrireducens]|uniref:hypothetical protein n=1 Tax=Aciditerrimonas ferrireducens TaxID=667306 RepID=UPI002004CF84|nr:hypothetical protein [Aciditerrimonas ferrireducens]MCK4177687.1 hypothetical protein [Aciditerrimonas ferrireducens]
MMAELGDDFLRSLVGAVDSAREDLEAFRSWQPAWFPSMAERTLASFVHDRIWDSLGQLLGPHDGLTMREAGVIREVVVGRYRLRLKRHDFDNRISNYPTQTALSFWIQEHDGMLPGTEEVRLAAGYRWDRETRSMGPALLSYRDGQDNVMWAVEIESPADAVTPIRVKQVDWPPAPRIELPSTRRGRVAPGNGDRSTEP